MATSYSDVKARCPFFRFSTDKKVVCEGITDSCSTALEFSKGEGKRLHRNLFCDDRYENCEIYRMLEEKYEE